MKKIVFTTLAFFVLITTQAIEVSKNAYFSILTCSPGTEVHAYFGHTAIRYVDTVSHIDIVFNYGLFSYTDDFVYNFVKGKTYYQLGVQRFSGFVSEYYMDNRGVLEQKLNLTYEETQALFNFLETNYLPENRKYLYNFFYDNCSSRPRDIIQKILGDKFSWNEKHMKFGIADTLWMAKTSDYLKHDFESRTWRDFIHMYVGSDLWLRFGMSLGLGLPSDSHISEFQTMFLPDCLFLMAESATINRGGTIVPLVSETHYLVKPEPEIKESSWFTLPAVVLWFICFVFLAIAIVEYKYKKHLYWLDSFLYFMLGIVGIFVWYVSLFSIHPTVFPNFNLIWASPFHVVFAILWLFPKLRMHTKWYLIIYSFILGLYIITAPINPQYVHAGYVAIMVILVSRLQLKKVQ